MREWLKRWEDVTVGVNKVYTTPLTHNFLMVGVCLIIVSTLIGYTYFSTLGNIGTIFSKQLMVDYVYKIIISLVMGSLIYLIIGSLKREKLTIKQRLNELFKSPVLAYSVLLILLLSYDVSLKALLIGTFIISILVSRSKQGYIAYSIHPVILGYLSTVFVEVNRYAKFDLFGVPTVLNTPFTTSLSSQAILTYDQFTAQYYSLETVIFGFYEGSLSFTLMIFIAVTALLLLKRRMINFLLLCIYLGGVILSGIMYGKILGLDSWLITLGVLNGNVLFIATFLLSDPVVLPKRKSYCIGYVSLLTLLTVYMTYHVHFILGPFTALLIGQLSCYLVRVGVTFKIFNMNKTKNMKLAKK